MKTIGKIITLIERRLSEILLLFIVVFVFIAASLRWFGYPLVWSVDLAQLLFIWISFIGADIALQNNKHIGVDILTRKLPEKVNKKIKFISYLLMICFLILVAYYGTYLAIMNYKRQFSGWEFSYSWATSAAPVGCILMLRTLIKKLYYLITNKTPPDIEGEDNNTCASSDEE
jgi:TRAP-type C4-dicarboxylate transport system permease small subunit